VPTIRDQRFSPSAIRTTAIQLPVVLRNLKSSDPSVRC
jgi:hypothetical protein